MTQRDLQALLDFRSETPEPDEATVRRVYRLATRPRARRRRLVARAAVVAAAATAVALGGLSLLPGGETSAVARAAAALAPAGDVVVHTVVVSTTVDPAGRSSTMTVETWRRSTPPYDERVVASRDVRRREHAVAAGRPLFYDGRTNTIHTLPPGTPIAPPESTSDVPALSRLTRALVGGGSAEALVPMLQDVLASGDAREAGRATVGGRKAIRIIFAGQPMTLLVDAETYEPLEWTVVSDEGVRLTSRFDTYELLPSTEANLALLSLTAQYPDATVAPTLELEGVDGRK